MPKSTGFDRAIADVWEGPHMTPKYASVARRRVHQDHDPTATRTAKSRRVAGFSRCR
jgi:hypothetical protein